MKFGEKVREERTKKGLTQPELGKLVGVTKRTIIGWESGERYPQKRELYDKLAKARDTGASVVGMDIDAAGLITLRKMGRPVSPKPVDTLREIIARAGLKFIVKGVMTVEDARFGSWQITQDSTVLRAPLWKALASVLEPDVAPREPWQTLHLSLETTARRGFKAPLSTTSL